MSTSYEPGIVLWGKAGVQGEDVPSKLAGPPSHGPVFQRGGSGSHRAAEQITTVAKQQQE